VKWLVISYIDSALSFTCYLLTWEGWTNICYPLAQEKWSCKASSVLVWYITRTLWAILYIFSFGMIYPEHYGLLKYVYFGIIYTQNTVGHFVYLQFWYDISRTLWAFKNINFGVIYNNNIVGLSCLVIHMSFTCYLFTWEGWTNICYPLAQEKWSCKS
jgi:hypothetical protein